MLPMTGAGHLLCNMPPSDLNRTSLENIDVLLALAVLHLQLLNVDGV